MDSFKKFYNKSLNKKDIDKTVLEKMFQIAKEINSQNQSYGAEELAEYARDQYMNSEIERIQNIVNGCFDQLVDDLKQVIPEQNINIDKQEEDSKNEETK